MNQQAKKGWWDRNWKWFVPVGCFGLIILFAVSIGLIMMFVFGAMKSSDAYKQALFKAQNNPTVQQYLGTPIEDGLWLAGNINVSGSSGKADINFPISGPKGDATVHLDATKFAGQWKFNKLIVVIDDTKQQINLLGP